MPERLPWGDMIMFGPVSPPALIDS